MTHLEQAVALDPSYAQAHAALANSRLLLAAYSGADLATGASGALAAIEQSVYKALALDPSLSDAHGALGNFLRASGRPGAEDAYKRALVLNPNNAIVTHNYSLLLDDQESRSIDTAAMNERTLELDPRSAIAWTNKLEYVYNKKGAAEYSKQFTKAIQVFDGDADGLGTLALAAKPELPYEGLELSQAIERAGGDRTTALIASLDPLIALGDYPEALARIDIIKTLGVGDPFHYRPYLLLALGLNGDFERLNASLPDAPPMVAAHYKYAIVAFWLSVQGRFAEATDALAAAGHVEEFDGWPMGSSMERGALPALIRIYAANGREREVREMAARFVNELKKRQRNVPPRASHTVVLAGIAAANGERAAAVQHLQQAMKLAPLPELFYPQLPWFKSLEGEPGYAELTAELKRRQAEIRARLASLDQGASLAPRAPAR